MNFIQTNYITINFYGSSGNEHYNAPYSSHDFTNWVNFIFTFNNSNNNYTLYIDSVEIKNNVITPNLLNIYLHFNFMD